MKTWKTVVILAILIWIVLTILCYLFDWPWPVFCCWFHNWVNKACAVNSSWDCHPDNGTDGTPPLYTCNDGNFPACDGSCPLGQECIEYYDTALLKEGCKCIPALDEDEPGETNCSDTDSYADIMVYGTCTDRFGTYPDDCVTDHMVDEYWCESGYCMSNLYQCPGNTYLSGCWLGRCVDCVQACHDDGRYNGGYFSGGIACDVGERWLSHAGCCCFPN